MTTKGPVRRLARRIADLFLANGVLISGATGRRRLAGLVGSLMPVRTRFPLIRLGGEFDGGYLVPDDLEGLVACYSPGVDVTADFERQLLDRGVESHLADASVDGPPGSFKAKSFMKKFIGAVDDGRFMTLDHWVAATEPGQSGDFILQMDIEGSEYVSILAARPETLERFRIIVMEVHWLEAWGLERHFEVVEAMFGKLLASFHVVHLHPNNFGGVTNIRGVRCPRVIELTLLRKDRSPALGRVEALPNPLDRPNRADRSDLPVPPEWYGEAAS